jgi:hypothetical protein
LRLFCKLRKGPAKCRAAFARRRSGVRIPSAPLQIIEYSAGETAWKIVFTADLITHFDTDLTPTWAETLFSTQRCAGRPLYREGGRERPQRPEVDGRPLDGGHPRVSRSPPRRSSRRSKGCQTVSGARRKRTWRPPEPDAIAGPVLRGGSEYVIDVSTTRALVDGIVTLEQQRMNR